MVLPKQAVCARCVHRTRLRAPITARASVAMNLPKRGCHVLLGSFVCLLLWPPHRYVAALEQRLRKVESLLHGVSILLLREPATMRADGNAQLLPNVDLSKDIDKLRLEDIVPRRGVVVPQSEIMPKPPPPSTIILDGLDCNVPAGRAGSTYSPTDDDYTSSDDDGPTLPLEDPLHGAVSQKIYVGKSSSVRLLNHAFSKAGDGGANVLLGHARWRRPKFWSVPLVGYPLGHIQTCAHVPVVREP